MSVMEAFPGAELLGVRQLADPLRLHPIEQAFARIKHWMRDAQKRTIDDTWRHVGHLVATIEPDQCRNYFQNAGYASVKT